jgi:chromosome partitioning protein
MIKSYVIWNNKGGVGKSTITFHIASVYAEKHPDEDVVIIDMCPQANSSLMLLGGGKQGERNLQALISQNTPQSVVGYIADTLIKGKQSSAAHVVQLDQFNNNLTPNMFLLCGDGNLELIAPLLAERANATPLSAHDTPWEVVHSIIKNMTSAPREGGQRSCTYFIDTNPSFSIYTEIAILAAEHLLVPINADDSSIIAITGLFNLIFGASVPHPVYGNYTFASKVNANKMRRPLIHLLLGNRFTQLKGSAHAFKALSDEASTKMYDEYKGTPGRFRSTGKGVVNGKADFEREYSIELRDFNSAGVVAANQGLPLSRMDRHSYDVYGESIQVSKEQRRLCKETIEELVARV